MTLLAWKMATLSSKLVCLFAISCVVHGNEQFPDQDGYSVTPTEGQPWPLPQKYSVTKASYSIDSKHFQFDATGQTCDILTNAFSRYKTIMFGPSDTKLRFHPRHLNRIHRVYAGSISSLNVKVQMPCEKYPSLGMDESCEYYNVYSALPFGPYFKQEKEL